MPLQNPPTTFAEFYPLYLDAHSQDGTRRAHVAGAAWFVGCLIAAGITSYNQQRGATGLLVLGVAGCYGAAWASHWLIEKNQPLTFRYPLWSLRAFWKMVGEIVFLGGTVK